MGWDMREGLLGWDAEVGNASRGRSAPDPAPPALLGWDAEVGNARAWVFGRGGCSVLFGLLSIGWRFGHDLAISVMT